MAVSAIRNIPLGILLPSLAGSLAYLNARLFLTYDAGLINALLRSVIPTQWASFRDRLNLFSVLESHALHKKRSQRIFIIHEGRKYTYQEAYENVLRYAAWLQDRGVQSGEVVAMDFMNSEVFVWVWFALWSLGAKPAFINYNLTSTPLLHCIKTSSAKLLLVDGKVGEKYTPEVVQELGSPEFREKEKGGGSIETVVLDTELRDKIESGEGWRADDSVRAGQELQGMAMLIYTSGTTGLPKPAVIGWWKAYTGSGFVSAYLPVRKNDVLYTCMPLYHSSASILGLLAVLQANGTLSLGSKFSTKTFWSDVRSTNSTILQYVGETCRYLLAPPPSGLDKAHKVRLIYGNGMRPDVWHKFKARFAIDEIAEFYGATEAPSMMWNRSRNEFSAGAIGRNGTLARIALGRGLAVVKVDHENNDELIRDPKTGLCVQCDSNEPGELLYKLDPANVERKFQGYFGNRKASSKKIIRDVKARGDAWFATGDVMRWDRENRWWFVDRIGDTFRWKSENVSTAEVAHAVGLHPKIHEANVYGVLVPGHDGRAGCAAVIFDGLPTSVEGDGTEVIAKPPTKLLEELASHNTSSLPRYAVPLFLRVCAGFATTGTNKQQKHHLREDGIEVAKVKESGDRMYWLRDGIYVEFDEEHLDEIRGGRVKL